MKQKVLLLFLATAVCFAARPLFSVEKTEKAAAESCVRCHRTLEGRQKDVVLEWSGSVHSRSGGCSLCHGGNPDASEKKAAMNPAQGFAARPNQKASLDFCGKGGCHAGEIRLFRKGAHYPSVLKTHEPHCASCHGSHAIDRASTKNIKETFCKKCHDESMIRETLASFRAADKAMSGVTKNLSVLKGKHVETAKISTRLKQIKDAMSSMAHVMTKDEISASQKIIELQAENLITETNSMVTLTKRLDFFYVVMIVFGLGFILSMSTYTIIMYTRRK